MESLIKNPNVLYIYDFRGEAFGLENIWKYLVIIKENRALTTDLPVKVITISEWFELIEKCEILPWICACINKKYILKEHVKLMMSTNPLQLRKNYEEAKKQASTNFEWMNLFIRIGCTNQIIENHKLRRLDFSSAYRVFTYTKNPEETFYKLGSREIAWLKRYTDEMYLKDKMKCKQS